MKIIKKSNLSIVCKMPLLARKFGSKLDDNKTEAGVHCAYKQQSHYDITEEAIHLGANTTVAQAEVLAVVKEAYHLIFAETNNNMS